MGLRADRREWTITAMVVTLSVLERRLRAGLLAVLCLGLNACDSSEAPPLPAAAQASQAGSPQPARTGPVGRAEVVGDLIVVRKPGAVSVLARLDGRPLWSVPQRSGDPITKARLAQGSIVVVRGSHTAEVYDLKTGALRFAREKAGALGVSWTMLYADSAACQPDCLLRGYDLEAGSQRWVGPKSLPGKVMTEVGQPQDSAFDPAG